MSLLFKLQNIGFAISVGTLSVLAVHTEPAKAYGLDATCHYSSPSTYKEFNCTYLPTHKGVEIFMNSKKLMTIKYRSSAGVEQICIGNTPCQNLSYVAGNAVEWKNNKGTFNFLYIPQQ